MSRALCSLLQFRSFALLGVPCRDLLAMATATAASSLTTALLYYGDTYLFQNTAKVLAVSDTEVDGKMRTTVILDQTVMHPQGGGQPSDIGQITSTNEGSIKFEVDFVQKPKGSNHVEHLGVFKNDQRFAVGDDVKVEISESRRRLNARIHSAGHLLDTAFDCLKVSDLVPSKGYHFPEGPYVEYIGNIPVEKREETIASLNAESARLIKEAIPTQVTTSDQGEREVNVGGTPCMCGGTHVKNTSEIRGLTVTKIKKSKKNIRVSYVITDTE